jgi:DNA relaxase NicK
MYWKRLSVLSTNCSRIDLAVTVEAPHERQVVRRALEQYRAWSQGRHNAANWSYVTSNHGDTFYLGKRSSDLFARVYDKGAQDPENFAPGTYRFEVEVKGKTAQPVCQRLRHERSAETAVLGYVTHYLRSRGIDCPWDAPNIEVELHAFRPVSTDESRLRWLADTVAPVVEQLLARHDRAIVLGALGLRE